MSGSACHPLPRAAKPLGDKACATCWVAGATPPSLPPACQFRPVGFVLGAPPRAGAFGHSDWAASTPIRSRRFRIESRYSFSHQSFPQSAPILWGSGCGVRPGHRRCPAASPAALRAAEAQPIQPPQFCEVRSRPQPAENEDGAQAEYFGPPHPEAAGRPLSRGLSYSLSTQSKDQSTITSTAQFTAPAKPHARPNAARKP